ncbi:hypothetical protein PIB30_085953, partial [Stylosanthes scabra]|nr:hypothetical protein [Stylosanthes scabra]
MKAKNKKPGGRSKSASNPLLKKERGFVCLDSSRRRTKFLQPQAVYLPGNKPVAQKLRRMNPEKASK